MAAREEAIVDHERPWPGLVSYDESSSDFFYGRGDQCEALLRLVRREPLTVLFGQSGLGKSSLLRAGLFPRMRQEAMIPVAVRLDYQPLSPPLGEQVKNALLHELVNYGVAWADAPDQPTLWQMLHLRGCRPIDALGNELTPVIVLDQFEELFTIGLSQRRTAERCRAFIEELADLIENRCPAELRRAFETEALSAASYEFGRRSSRILLSLREDYLASLEEIRARAPSIGGGWSRLPRMRRSDARDAILGPGGHLLAPGVADDILTFVGARSNRSGIEMEGALNEQRDVEPSLLSLFCRELNEERLRRGRATITADLVAESQEGILSGFYERALADQPEPVRTLIEDELVTETGIRADMPVERAAALLRAQGAQPEALSILVERRILHVTERFGVSRVELIHDVLVDVVLRSRADRVAAMAVAQATESSVRFRRLFVRIAQITAIVAIIPLLIAIFVLPASQNASLRRATAMQEHSYQVLNLIRRVEANINGAEVNLGAYVVSGDRSFGLAYSEKWSAAGSDINRLITMLSDNPGELRLATKLQRSYEARGRELGDTARYVVYKRNRDALGSYYLGISTAASSSVKTEINSLFSEEQNLLSNRSNDVYELFNSTNLIVTILSISTAILMCAVALLSLLVRHLNRRFEEGLV